MNYRLNVIFLYFIVLRMADALEYEESVVHHDSTLSASFDNVRRNVPQGNEESSSKSKRQRLKEKFEWKEETVGTLTILWENQPVLLVIHSTMWKRPEEIRLCWLVMKLKIVVFFHHQVLMTFLGKSMLCALTLVPRKNKMEQSKTSGTGRSVNYRRRWQFYESLFLADFITPPNTESNLERCQQTNSEKKTQIKADKQKQTVGVTELNRTVKVTYYSSQVWRFWMH